MQLLKESLNLGAKVSNGYFWEASFHHYAISNPMVRRFATNSVTAAQKNEIYRKMSEGLDDFYKDLSQKFIDPRGGKPRLICIFIPHYNSFKLDFFIHFFTPSGQFFQLKYVIISHDLLYFQP